MDCRRLIIFGFLFCLLATNALAGRSSSSSSGSFSGLSVTGDGDGAITFQGQGDGFDENLTLNLDDTENTGTVTSSTGLNLINFSSISLQVPTEVYDATGWNGDLTIPTKDAVRDKIEALSASDTWTNTSNVLNAVTATDNVTVGSATNLGKLAVDGDTDEIQLLVQGNATQTSNVFVVEQSDGTDLFTVANDGTITSVGSGTEALTLGSGNQATYVTTYDLSGTDWTMTAGSALATFSGGVTIQGTTTISQGAAPTISAAGNIGVDTTDDQLKYYGAAVRTIPYTLEKCWTVQTPASSDDNVPIFVPVDNITITGVYCMTQGGTSVGMTLSDGTNALEEVVCDSNGQADDGSIANGTFSAAERMEFDTGTVSGTVDWCMTCIRYTVDAQ